MSEPVRYDMVVIGSGPAGQKAAIQGAKAGLRVAIVEREREVGGVCVHRGTIPSKALQDAASLFARVRRAGPLLETPSGDPLRVGILGPSMGEVVKAHVAYQTEQLRRNEVECIHGRASFRGDRLIEVLGVDGARRMLSAQVIVVATGSRPRVPEDVPVDHEHVLDSDSILSLSELPRSLTVLGGGIIASEYASIFAALGVQVTVIDRAPRPLEMLEAELTERFVRSFQRSGGRWLAERRYQSVSVDGLGRVTTEFADGEAVVTEKMLVAVGRVPCLDGLGLEVAGLAVGANGQLEVDGFGRTAQPHIYAVGDVSGAPWIASRAMDAGRRAARHAVGLPGADAGEFIPLGVYSVPEMAAVGLTEAQAVLRFGAATVGRARFDEVARGRISRIQDGLLLLVADADGKKLLGVHIVGDGATEMIHIGQMALLMGADAELFVNNIFNFPTLAEAYRVAALDLENRSRSRAQRSRGTTAASAKPVAA